MRTLTFTAWLNVGLHLLGLALAMTGMRPGTPLVPATERVAYLAERPLLWSLGWATWMLCALALVAFLGALARAVPEAGAILVADEDCTPAWVRESLVPLLADRERLRAELERARLDIICKDFKPEFTREEVYSQVDRDTSIAHIIAELEHRAEKRG
jgi:hypothetical protein